MPSLHADELNPRIDFDRTPFIVQRTTAEWVPAADGRARHGARLVAGLSAFGAGGANAHAIVSSYEPADEAAAPEQPGPHVVVLSARTEDRLRARAAQLSAFLAQRERARPLRLSDVAWTLQVGREPLGERWAVVVADRRELARLLDAFVAGSSLDGAYRGAAPDGEDALPSVESVLAATERCLCAGRPLDLDAVHEIARAWTAGAEVAWPRLHVQGRARRIPLPTYPFAGERYWLPRGEEITALDHSSESPAAEAGHPLIGRNVSTLSLQAYATRIDVDRPFVRDHTVAGTSVVPAVIALEMARAAAAEALDGVAVTALSDVTWIRPLVVDQPLELKVQIARPDASRNGPSPALQFTLTTAAGGSKHVEGRVHTTAAAPPATLDLEAIRRRCTDVRSGAAVYAGFVDRGLRYGPTFQAIQELRVGHDESLARLAVPGGLDAELDRYLVHPALLDAALQAVVGCARPGQDALSVPFALDRMAFWAASPVPSYAYARRRSDAGSMARYDVALVDEGGATCVSFEGLTLKPMVAAADPPHTLNCPPPRPGAPPPRAKSSG